MSEEKKTTSKGQWHGGKGSIQKDHDHDKYAEAWEKIFGKKTEYYYHQIFFHYVLQDGQRAHCAWDKAR